MRLGVVVLLLSCAGCCDDPWAAFPMSTAPDRSCSTGDVHGNDVYVWDCVDGRHVVIAQYSAEMSCRAPVRETSACGSTTPLERELALGPETCAGPRPGRAWR